MQIYQKYFLALIFLVLIFSPNISAQKIKQKIKMPKDADIRKITQWMSGTFDTFAQVEQDEAGNSPYLHTRALVHVVPVSIIGLATDGMAMYVENQVSNARNKPYRQRIYFLQRSGGNLIAHIYKIENETDFVNAYRKPEIFQNLTADHLNQEQGCDITFQRVKGGIYVGIAGQDKTCRSSLRGATYTTSKMELSSRQWTNLDQGFDETGAHKWGPPPGTVGHIFLKRKTDN